MLNALAICEGRGDFTIKIAHERGRINAGLDPSNKLGGEVKKFESKKYRFPIDGVKCPLEVNLDEYYWVLELGIVDAVNDLLDNVYVIMNSSVFNKCRLL